MLIPSIDIVGGRAVQMVGGEEIKIDGGDPLTWFDRFSLFGEVAVVDIDAARGDGDNAELIREMCGRGAVRVGGGIRDVEGAIAWLDRGARKVVVGTAASPELFSRLPRSRVVAAIDSKEGRVVTHGWRAESGETLLDRVGELAPYCDGILVTFVELEGRLGGTDLERAALVVEQAGATRVTVAGGINTAGEIRALDELGADAQIGMALYSGELGLAEAFTAPLRSDRPDGLWPTVVVDEHECALGLVYSSLESVRAALTKRAGVYHSRSRGVWEKGLTSGATQELLGLSVDCDRDTLRFRVRQRGPGFCHLGSRTCWGEDISLGRLARRIDGIVTDRPDGSNTVTLLDHPDLLAAKLSEEAAELGEAAGARDVAHEAADLIYFALVKAAAAGVSLDQVESELFRREQRVTRRPMQRTRS